MTFSHPWVVALWLIPVFLLLWEAFRKSPTVALPFDHQEHRRRPWLRRSLWLAATLPPAILVITIGVVAGPQVMGEPQKRREITNIEICLDVSGSMGVMMSDGTLRNDAAVAAIQNFCEARRGDACGLTIFGGETIRWTPLTLDLDAIALAAPFIDPRKMPPHMLSTRIGGALRSCMGSLSEQEEGDRMVVLVSDGFSSDLSGGAARQVGQELAALDIALYAIFIGDGSAPGQLYEVVAQTQGEVFAAHDSEALQRVFDHIDSMKPAKLKPAGARPIEDFSLLAWCGLALLALHLLASLGLRVTPW